ncbi:CRAL-TRIO domain-containing protein [Paraphysoderma sedebokerense]|nr:CRAL-TRIO domain-containing protein [Paraphysoderma sedebokerense]
MSKLPTEGRLGHLTVGQSKALAQLWASLLEFLWTDPNGSFDISKAEEYYDELKVSRGKLKLPEISIESAPPIVPTKASPDHITRAVIRQSLWTSGFDFHPSDLLLKFLRYRWWNVKDAFVCLLRSIYWRLDNDIQGLMEKGESVISRKEFGEKGFIYKFDRCGRPVIYVNIALHLMDSNLQTEFQRHIKYMIEIGANMLKAPADQTTVVVNMQGFNEKNMDLALGGFLFDLQNYYPDVVANMLIVNAPFFIPAAYKIVKPFIEPLIRFNLQFVSKSDLSKFIDPDDIPKSFGGNDPYEFKYFAPSEKDLARKVDKQRKADILAQRMGEVINVENYFAKWAMMVLVSNDEEKVTRFRADKEDKLLHRLRQNYWEFDSCTRAPSMFHRLGVIKRDVIDWNKMKGAF